MSRYSKSVCEKKKRYETLPEIEEYFVMIVSIIKKT